MKSQVLTIEQMKELEALGVDTSKASMFWHPAFYRVNGILDYDRYEDIPRIKLENNYNLEYDIPTFTLQDIIDLIISWAEYDFCVAHNKAFLFDLSDSDTTVPFHMEVGTTTIEAAFEMLKWCKQNES